MNETVHRRSNRPDRQTVGVEKRDQELYSTSGNIHREGAQGWPPRRRGACEKGLGALTALCPAPSSV